MRGSIQADSPSQKASFRQLLKQIHHDETGGVSIETVLIIAAIALPILIFILKIGWPMIKNWWDTQMREINDAGPAGGAGR